MAAPQLEPRVEVTDATGRRFIADTSMAVAELIFDPRLYRLRQVEGYPVADGFCIVNRRLEVQP